MKKIIKWCTLGTVAVMLLSGCTKKDTATVNDETTITAESSEDATGSTNQNSLSAIVEDNVVLGAEKDKVELADYKEIEVTLEPIEVTDEQVQQQIETLLAKNIVELDVTDRPAKEGDTVNIDYVGLKDGVAFEGGTANGYDLTLGSGQFIEGFEDGLIGSTVGEERDLNLTFPEQYQNEELAGAEVVFQVTVNSIKSIETPELDDDFVKQYAKTATTVDEYRDELKQELYDTAYEGQKNSAAFIYVMNNSQFELTDQSVEETFQKELENITFQAQMYGMTLEDYLAAYQMDEATLKEQLLPEARNYLKQQLIVEAVKELEKLEVKQEDVEALADKFGYASVEAMIAEAGDDEINNYVLTEQVFKLFGANVIEK